jgi:hypothetical protein
MIHALILGAVTSTAGLKPVRTMVYSFTYSTPSEQHKGTIHADVLGVTQDGGLVVRFSQQVDGQPNQTFAPTDCAVYGDTRVQCQGASALGPYESELGHLLGRNFVDGNSMDEKNHWRVAGTMGNNKVTDDFTVLSNNAGILTIDEVRDVTGSGNTTHHTAQITYDLNKTVPTKVKYTEAAVTVEYALQSDWIVPKPSPSPKP